MTFKNKPKIALMKYKSIPAASQIRMLFLTMLVAVIGFAFLAQLSDSYSYSDDSARVRVAEVQEFLHDAEPPPQYDSSTDFLAASFLFFCVNIGLTSVLLCNKFTPRLTFLYHIRPRSPPLH